VKPWLLLASEVARESDGATKECFSSPSSFSCVLAFSLMLVLRSTAMLAVVSTFAIAPRASVRLDVSSSGSANEEPGTFEAFEASFDSDRSRQAAAFTRPTSAAALRNYFLGEWNLRKATVYSVGGISGRFEGSCVFEILLDPRRGKSDPMRERGLLAYSEFGQFRPDSNPDQVLETRNRLVYDFTDPARVNVFFDDSFDRSEEAVVSALRFDHSLSPLSLEMSEASDAPGGDNSATYSGKLDIEAQNAFVSTWGVKSDAIDGVILSMFSRSGVHQHE